MKIVVVEDDKSSRRLMEKACTGHEVITHRAPDDVFNEAAWEGADLAVVDMVFRTGSGKVSGLDLLIWLGEHRPGLPRMVVTGFTSLDREVLENLSEYVLWKPIDLTEVRRVLASVSAQR